MKSYLGIVVMKSIETKRIKKIYQETIYIFSEILESQF